VRLLAWTDEPAAQLRFESVEEPEKVLRISNPATEVELLVGGRFDLQVVSLSRGRVASAQQCCPVRSAQARTVCRGLRRR
jgi:hypothetical protein